ncbi:MAG TPA: fumarate reductase/succinate dehydrogenase flavoprotein subunit, partial [Verrucomicrobiales bacterium]|nr:fumarate reductase/succinate dehydrogenase flavoprotein subunit [Verrucomicrobiales bacterium]
IRRARVAAVAATPSVMVIGGLEARRLLVDDRGVAGVLAAGQFSACLLPTRRIVLATGGLGGLFGHTTNPLGAVGQGVALAARAGAALVDMEFVQFHPTGMVWPPSVMGILVTEGVRGEGGILLNKDGQRFMFGDIPENYKAQTADNAEEGWRYCQGDKNARRPPELLTRDHVARCIVREIKHGRGGPHGGVFLDISWIKQKLPDAAEHIKRKLPCMYHQFKELADIDITQEPMEVGPTTHYVMGGVRVDAETQMSNVPGLFAAGECAAGINGANRLGGNSLSDIIVFGKRAGEFAAKFARSQKHGVPSEQQIGEAARRALEPFDFGTKGEPPYQIQSDLQGMMQELVGIVRRKDEMARALEGLGALQQRARKTGVPGNREYNPGWHTALDLRNLLTVSEAVTRSALEREESRGAHFREDFPEKDATFGKVNLVVWKGADGGMQLRREPIPKMPDYLERVIKEMK